MKSKPIWITVIIVLVAIMGIVLFVLNKTSVTNSELTFTNISLSDTPLAYLLPAPRVLGNTLILSKGMPYILQYIADL